MTPSTSETELQEQLRKACDDLVRAAALVTPGVVAIVVLAKPDPGRSAFAVATNASRMDAIKLLTAAGVTLGAIS